MWAVNKMRIIVVVFTDWPVDSVVAVSVNQLDIRFYCQCAALAGVIKSNVMLMSENTCNERAHLTIPPRNRKFF